MLVGLDLFSLEWRDPKTLILLVWQINEFDRLMC